MWRVHSNSSALVRDVENARKHLDHNVRRNAMKVSFERDFMVVPKNDTSVIAGVVGGIAALMALISLAVVKMRRRQKTGRNALDNIRYPTAPFACCVS